MTKNKTPQDIYKELNATIPFKWRVQSYSKNRDKATCVAYIQSRDVMDLLDQVVGFENWQTKMIPYEGGMICELSLKIDGEWVTKTDIGSTSSIDKDTKEVKEQDAMGEKGDASDAIKRAAVHWGIGRFLYKMGMQFVEARVNNGYPEVFDPSTGKTVYSNQLTDFCNAKRGITPLDTNSNILVNTSPVVVQPATATVDPLISAKQKILYYGKQNGIDNIIKAFHNSNIDFILPDFSGLSEDEILHMKTGLAEEISLTVKNLTLDQATKVNTYLDNAVGTVAVAIPAVTVAPVQVATNNTDTNTSNIELPDNFANGYFPILSEWNKVTTSNGEMSLKEVILSKHAGKFPEDSTNLVYNFLSDKTIGLGLNYGKDYACMFAYNANVLNKAQTAGLIPMNEQEFKDYRVAKLAKDEKGFVAKYPQFVTNLANAILSR